MIYMSIYLDFQVKPHGLLPHLQSIPFPIVLMSRIVSMRLFLVVKPLKGCVCITLYRQVMGMDHNNNINHKKSNKLSLLPNLIKMTYIPMISVDGVISRGTLHWRCNVTEVMNKPQLIQYMDDAYNQNKTSGLFLFKFGSATTTGRRVVLKRTKVRPSLRHFTFHGIWLVWVWGDPLLATKCRKMAWSRRLDPIFTNLR